MDSLKWVQAWAVDIIHGIAVFSSDDGQVITTGPKRLKQCGVDRFLEENAHAPMVY